MAGRGTLVSIAFAFALVLLNVSVCKCVTVTYSSKGEALNDKERDTVYSVLQAMVDNAERDIQVDREYYAGRLFTKYIKLNEKGVVIRMTRWSKECSVSMSPRDTTEGRELLEAFKRLLPTIRPYLLGKGSEWVAASDSTDWIDYYVRQPYNAEKEAPPQESDRPFDVIHSGSSVTDCAIKPSMLLSHHSALPFNQLLPGESLSSPDGKYKLLIPGESRRGILQPCVLMLEDDRGNVLWQSEYGRSMPQRNCFLAFRTDGDLELRNMNDRIWNTDSACSSVVKCAGTASLALSDGDFKLYRSVDDHLSPYWSAKASNS